MDKIENSGFKKNSYQIKPIIEKKNVVEEKLKKEGTDEILAKAIRKMLSEDNDK